MGGRGIREGRTTAVTGYGTRLADETEEGNKKTSKV
jgi:hypothetical protein